MADEVGTEPATSGLNVSNDSAVLTDVATNSESIPTANAPKIKLKLVVSNQSKPSKKVDLYGLTDDEEEEEVSKSKKPFKNRRGGGWDSDEDDEYTESSDDEEEEEDESSEPELISEESEDEVDLEEEDEVLATKDSIIEVALQEGESEAPIFQARRTRKSRTDDIGASENVAARVNSSERADQSRPRKKQKKVAKDDDDYVSFSADAVGSNVPFDSTKTKSFSATASVTNTRKLGVPMSDSYEVGTAPVSSLQLQSNNTSTRTIGSGSFFIDFPLQEEKKAIHSGSSRSDYVVDLGLGDDFTTNITQNSFRSQTQISHSNRLQLSSLDTHSSNVTEEKLERSNTDYRIHNDVNNGSQSHPPSFSIRQSDTPSKADTETAGLVGASLLQARIKQMKSLARGTGRRR
jgi:hypothetical protein